MKKGYLIISFCGLVAAPVAKECVAGTVAWYAGAAAGQTDMISDHTVGWKAMAGFRPFPYLGAEAEYVDFGHMSSRNVTVNPGNTCLDICTLQTSVTADGAARAAALFAVGYIPLSVAPLDFFAKAGVARIRSTYDATYSPIPIDSCITHPSGQGCPIHESGSQTRFAWGAGLQVRVSAVALRAEFERYSAVHGSPSLVSVGAAWNFDL